MNRISVLVTLVLASALVLAGCFQHTYVVGKGAPEGEVVYKHWHHHWLFGTIRPKLQEELLVSEYCASGNATIHQEMSFVNGLINVLIGIIYSPTTVTIQCDDGTTAEIELDAEDVARIVNDPTFLEVVAELVPERLEETRLALAGLAAETELAVAP